MTVKIRVSVPDAVLRALPEARRARRREAARAGGERLRQPAARPAEDDRMLIESSHDIALRDSRW